MVIDGDEVNERLLLPSRKMKGVIIMHQKRMIKQHNTTMRGFAGKQVRRCNETIYSQIENDDYKIKHGVSSLAGLNVKTKHKSRWLPGYCKICGEYMQVITHLHAAEHGYKSAEEFIADDNVRFE
jgi:hypothetical protein